MPFVSQVSSTTIPYSTSAKTSTNQNKKLHTYFQNIGWNATKFTNRKLETMLAASCLRYLGGLEDLSFVIDLAKEIRNRYKTTMKLSLWYSTDIIKSISEQIYANSLSLQDGEAIHEMINDAQECITHQRFSPLDDISIS